MASGPKLARGSIKFSRKARRIQRRLRVTCTAWTTKNIEGSFCFRKRAGSCSRSGSAAGAAQWMSGSSNRKFVRQSSSILFRLHGTGKRLSRFFYEAECLVFCFYPMDIRVFFKPGELFFRVSKIVRREGGFEFIFLESPFQ